MAGHTAQRTTYAEFKDIMGKFSKVAAEDLKEHAKDHPRRRDLQPRFAFDRARIHNVNRLLQDLKLPAEAIVDLPHYAPDLQKPIEHVHGICKAAFKKMLLVVGMGHDAAFYNTLYEDIFMSLKPGSIKKDIMSLPTTFNHILAPVSKGGSDGGYARKGFN